MIGWFKRLFSSDNPVVKTVEREGTEELTKHISVRTVTIDYGDDTEVVSYERRTDYDHYVEFYDEGYFQVIRRTPRYGSTNPRLRYRFKSTGRQINREKFVSISEPDTEKYVAVVEVDVTETYETHADGTERLASRSFETGGIEPTIYLQSEYEATQ